MGFALLPGTLSLFANPISNSCLLVVNCNVYCYVSSGIVKFIASLIKASYTVFNRSVKTNGI